MKHDNCKDCKSNCEHAGKDREFVCIGGVSCKKTETKKIYLCYKVDFDRLEDREPIIRKLLGYVETEEKAKEFCEKIKPFYKGWEWEKGEYPYGEYEEVEEIQ